MEKNTITEVENQDIRKSVKNIKKTISYEEATICERKIKCKDSSFC